MRRTGRPSKPLGRSPDAPPLDEPAAGKYEYKIITSGDERFFSGKFSPEALQAVLNEHASRGWRVISMTSSEYTSLMSGRGRNELVVVLERETEPS